MGQTILIFAYYSFKDPVFQSAVLPYFVNLKTNRKTKFVLLTFEHDQYPITKTEIISLRNQLKEHDIIWKQSRWRSGRLKVFKKFVDFISSVYVSVRIIRNFDINTIYTEGFPGAILSYYVCRLTGCKHIVHTFEPHADYMVEAGIWTENSWETKLQRWHEMKIARHATYILTATTFMIEKLRKEGIAESVLHRVPSCVETHHFQFSPEARKRIRDQHSIQDNEPVLVYLGKFGGMYMEGEAFDFFHLCQVVLKARIMILTVEPLDRVNALMIKHEVRPERAIIKRLSRAEVPAYLSAADIGLVAVRQWPSKIYCSPIKTGEYLSCGLPVIVPLGISDDAQTLSNRGIGILMKSLEKDSYMEVINEWNTWSKTKDPQELRKMARLYAQEDRSVERYQLLYSQLFETL